MVQRPRPRRPLPPTRAPSPARDEDETIQGLHAGLAVFAKRPDDVLRVAFSRAVRAEVSALARWAASHGVPCHEASEGELDRIAGAAHHEGLCVLARPRRWLSTGELADLLVRTRGTCLALDRVRNPYNVGAILRSAAFFGVDALLLGAPAPHPGIPSTAVRVAEGGVEHLALARTTDLADTLARVRQRGVRVVGADGSAQTDALDARFDRPSTLVLGNEREGLSDRIRAQCDAVVAIRGSGAVESLNVGVAAGILIARMTSKR
jgi:RNA methyltransferase, TrmH family